jgi:hypothetical protein
MGLKGIVFFVNRNKNTKVVFLFTLAFLLGCQSGLVNESDKLNASEGYSSVETDKLFVVDCLLPGQIRKLGTQMTYLTARRPIKTTAGDCEVRGGEYVAYDRANYASSLKVWLPQAKKGKVEAQVILGEIYEKGLGGLVDTKLAATWYRKAAEQGSSRAQINLGHLYEKGLGVEKSLPQALNWYRKASGLENTDLEFASVTEATVSANYEEQIQELKKESADYQKRANQLQHQLSQSRQNYSVQQKKLTVIKNQLKNNQQRLNHEKSKKDTNRQLIKKLENDLQSNQQIYSNQKTKLAKMQDALEKESQSSVSPYYVQLESQQQQLSLKESEYNDVNIRIKRAMKQIEIKSISTTTTQEKLVVEQLRGKLKTSKTDLLSIGKQIKQLKNNIAENKKIISNLETQGNLIYAHAGIEIIEPPMFLTRGAPSYQLRSIRQNKKIIGKVIEVKELQSLTINGHSIQVDNKGVFQTLIDIKNDLNPVEIVANYKQGPPGKLKFNLLVKGVDSDFRDQNPPLRATSNIYTSINFGRFYALIIGNKDYTQLPSLKTSVNDAKAVEEVLRTRYGYKTTLLINANRHQVMTAFNDLRKVLTENDNLLVYYAGHGEIDKSDQSAYWLPADAEIDNSANWLSSHSITQFLNIMTARHILVVADSCYSGAMTKGSIARSPAKIAEEKRKKWLKFMVKRKARTVMTSGGEKPVLDSGGGQHSIFAKAFLKVLKQNKGLMEDYELFRAVSGHVKKSASLIGFQQSPQYSAMLHAGHEGSPFFFVPNAQ